MILWSVILFFAISLVKVKGDYSNNPFFNVQQDNVNLANSGSVQKDINQINVAVLPPNQQVLQPPIGQPPYGNNPGFVWLQVPASIFNNKIPTGINSPPQTLPTVKPVLVNQKPGVVQPPITVVPPTILSPKVCPKPRGQFASKACNRFINCWDGVAIEQNCPEGLLFNELKSYCDYPSSVDCNKRPILENPPTTSGTTPPPTAASSPMYPTLPTQPTPTVDPALIGQCKNRRGQFPSKNCKNYINCWDGVAIEQECPEGLLFSLKGVCDYAENVDCTGRDGSVIIGPTVITTSPPLVSVVPVKPAPPQGDCSIEAGIVRDRLNCSVYFMCFEHKIAATYECPVGFVFNDDLGVCDYESRVNCKADPKALPLSKFFYSSSDTSSECPADFGLFRDKANCSLYYTCLNHKIVARHECPSGFNFNDNIGVCDYDYRVDCSKEPVPFQYRQSFVPQIPPDFMDKIEGCTPGQVFRLNSECSLACRCREGLVEVIQCPDGLAYDSPTDKCVQLPLARC